MWTNYVKVKLDNTQQNSKSLLNAAREEKANHRLGKCTKLVQREYKARNNSVRR